MTLLMHIHVIVTCKQSFCHGLSLLLVFVYLLPSVSSVSLPLSLRPYISVTLFIDTL